jgi:hypothetical protein
MINTPRRRGKIVTKQANNKPTYYDNLQTHKRNSELIAFISIVAVIIAIFTMYCRRINCLYLLL